MTFLIYLLIYIGTGITLVMFCNRVLHADDPNEQVNGFTNLFICIFLWPIVFVFYIISLVSNLNIKKVFPFFWNKKDR